MTKKQLNLLKLLIIYERDYYQQLTKVSPEFVSTDIKLVEVLPSIRYTAKALVIMGIAEYAFKKQGNDNPHIRLKEELHVN